MLQCEYQIAYFAYRSFVAMI